MTFSNDKFESTGETKDCYGITLYRIRARSSFGNVTKGDEGGWIDSEQRLSVSGNAWVSGDAAILWISKVGSENGTLTAFATEKGISVTRGCFIGTLDEFAAAVTETHGDSQIGAEYRLLIEFIKLRLAKVAP